MQDWRHLPLNNDQYHLAQPTSIVQIDTGWFGRVSSQRCGTRDAPQFLPCI